MIVLDFVASYRSLGLLLLGSLVGGSLLAPNPASAVEVDGTLQALRALRAGYEKDPSGLPTAFEVRHTAWQTAPRWLVLTGDTTPDEADPYVMTHPLLAFRWADGGVLLVDAGLSPDEARGFGRATEFLGAEATVCGRDAFEGLDPKSVRATVFSHLHVDHILGLNVLCAEGTRIPVRLSEEQRTSEERFEAQGRERIEEMAAAGCIDVGPLPLANEASAAPALEGFPGVHRVAVPGHTAGSQLVVGFVRAGAAEVRAVAIAGDVVNHQAAFRYDRPKPWLYRRWIVREVDELQAQNRDLLARLEKDGFEILVNHHADIPEGTAGVPCP